MNFSEALDRTIKAHGIQVKWLAEQAGVSQQMISGFRSGSQRIMTDSLEKIVSALPIEAKQYFFSQINNTGNDSAVSIAASVLTMDDDEVSIILGAIATKMQRGKKKPKPSEELISA